MYCILIVWWPWWAVTECLDILVGCIIHCIFTWWPVLYSVYWEYDDQLHGVPWHGKTSYTLCLEMVTSYTLCLDTVRPIILCILTWWPVICCVLIWWDQLYVVSCHGDQLFVLHLNTRMTCYKMHIDSLVTSYLLCLDMVTSYTLCLDMVTSFRLLWPCIMNVGWRERNQQVATNLMFIIKLLSQNVSSIIMLCALCKSYCSNSNFHTVHTAHAPTPRNHSQHKQCRTPYAAVHSLVLLMMGIMISETCWDVW